MADYEIVYPERSTEDVRRKRVIACVVDAIIIGILSCIVGIIVFVLGIFTLGLAWLLYGAIFPVVAILYAGMTIGGFGHATLGMRAVGLRFKLESGREPDFIHGAAHIVLFYLSVSILTPFILLITFFNERKRFLHDMLTNASIVNT